MKSFFRQLHRTAAFLLLAGQLQAQETVEIKPRWPVGKKLALTMQMDQVTTVALGAEKTEQKLGMTTESTTRVRLHENGSHKRVHVVYDRIAVSMDAGGGQVMKYDSARVENDPAGLGKGFDGIVGQEMKMVVNEKDELLEVENFEELMKGFAGDHAAAGVFGQMFSKDALKDMLRYTTLYSSPGKPVKPGDAWPVAYAMPMPQIGRLDINGSYSFRGMADRGGVRCAQIALEAKLELDFSAPASGAPANAAPLKELGMTMHNGKMTGQLWFDPALGVSRDARFAQEMTIRTRNPQISEPAIEIPMKQVITQTLTKVEDL